MKVATEVALWSQRGRNTIYSGRNWSQPRSQRENHGRNPRRNPGRNAPATGRNPGRNILPYYVKGCDRRLARAERADHRPAGSHHSRALAARKEATLGLRRERAQ